ncbi:MAG: glutathione S-transferase [Chrysiogenetes bacterium]|nr:glutathione S-transferase [Chrysiogenetes bacterium]
MFDLIALGLSPWSEKARWALDHSGIDYRESEYTPMLGEYWLRWRLRKFSGRVSVPALIGKEVRLTDSFEIARFADEHRTRGERLFPHELIAQIEEWNARSERATDSTRALLIERMLGDREALSEALPPMIPAPIRLSLTALAAQGSRFLRRKYRAREKSPTDHENLIRTELTVLRGALDGGDYIYDTLSYADIAMAVVLQFLIPPPEGSVAMGPATRRCARHPVLAEEFADLGRWRDRLYQRHR